MPSSAAAIAALPPPLLATHEARLGAVQPLRAAESMRRDSMHHGVCFTGAPLRCGMARHTCIATTACSAPLALRDCSAPCP